MIGSVLIVGASVAGIGAANELRRCGFEGKITLSDAQHHLPYDRPPLSKAALTDPATRAPFHDAEHYRVQRLDLKLGSPAAALDLKARSVTYTSGETVAADAIIIATGARARRLPSATASGPVHTIRDLDDAGALGPQLRPGRRLAMIGGGFIGAEVASTAVKSGAEVTLIDIDAVPLARVLGRDVAERVIALHAGAGVTMALGSGVDRVEQGEAGSTVMLSNGTRIDADIVVAGLGSTPNVEWLDGSGLSVANGVLCDAVGRTSASGIFAAGDVAAWVDPVSGEHRRHEHWTAAREQARIVAQHICGMAEATWAAFVPYFWSDMHGKRFQLLGTAEDATAVTFVFENAETGAFVAEYHRGDALIGVVGCNAAARVMRYAARLAERQA